MTLIVPQDDLPPAVFKNDIRNRLEVVYLEGLSTVGGKRRKRSNLDDVDFITHSEKLPVALDKGLYDNTKESGAGSDQRSVFKNLNNANWQAIQSGLWNLLIPSDRNNNNMTVHSRQRRQTVDPSNTTEVVAFQVARDGSEVLYQFYVVNEASVVKGDQALAVFEVISIQRLSVILGYEVKSPGITLFASPRPGLDYSVWIIIVSVVCGLLLIIVISFIIYWICLCHRKAHQSKVMELNTME